MSLFYKISFLSMVASVTCVCETDTLPKTAEDYDNMKGQGIAGERDELQQVCYAAAIEGDIEKNDDIINNISAGKWMKVKELDCDIFVVNCGFSDTDNQFVGKGDKINSLITYTCTEGQCNPCRRIENIYFEALYSYHPRYQQKPEYTENNNEHLMDEYVR